MRTPGYRSITVTDNTHEKLMDIRALLISDSKDTSPLLDIKLSVDEVVAVLAKYYLDRRKFGDKE